MATKNNCCRTHGDIPSLRSVILQGTEKIELRTGAGTDAATVPISGGCIAVTGFWVNSFGYAFVKQKMGTLHFTPSNVCKNHQRGVCNKGEACHWVHICREVWPVIQRSTQMVQQKAVPRPMSQGIIPLPVEANQHTAQVTVLQNPQPPTYALPMAQSVQLSQSFLQPLQLPQPSLANTTALAGTPIFVFPLLTQPPPPPSMPDAMWLLAALQAAATVPPPPAPAFVPRTFAVAPQPLPPKTPPPSPPRVPTPPRTSTPPKTLMRPRMATPPRTVPTEPCQGILGPPPVICAAPSSFTPPPTPSSLAPVALTESPKEPMASSMSLASILALQKLQASLTSVPSRPSSEPSLAIPEELLAFVQNCIPTDWTMDSRMAKLNGFQSPGRQGPALPRQSSDAGSSPGPSEGRKNSGSYEGLEQRLGSESSDEEQMAERPKTDDINKETWQDKTKATRGKFRNLRGCSVLGVQMAKGPNEGPSFAAGRGRPIW